MTVYAVMKKDEYTDLVLDFKYHVKSCSRDYIYLNERGGRRYKMSCFKYYDEDGKQMRYSAVKFWKQKYGHTFED